MNSHGNGLRQHFNSPCIHKQDKTKKDLRCEKLSVEQLAIQEVELFAKVIEALREAGVRDKCDLDNRMKCN